MSVSVKANYGGGGGGLFSSPIGRIAELGGGIATGNPMMIAGGAVGNKSPAGKALGAAGAATSAYDSFSSTPAAGAQGYQSYGDNALGSSGYTDQLDAMKRRFQYGYGGGG